MKVGVSRSEDVVTTGLHGATRALPFGLGLAVVVALGGHFLGETVPGGVKTIFVGCLLGAAAVGFIQGAMRTTAS